MARFRLRFLLQEFDLARGATVIGRSSDCHVTIEDPLVSREHAKIVIDDDGDVTLYDLRSRNGVKLNGSPVRGNAAVNDGDRIRIGTQELVFCRVDTAAEKSMKTTGFLRHCAQCRLPYPQEIKACPNCGSSELLEDETLRGDFGTQEQNAWSLQLLIEVLEKALAVGKLEDADRVFRKAASQCDERFESDGRLDEKALGTLAVAAVRIAVVTSHPEHAAWSIRTYERVSIVPTEDVQTYLLEAAARFVECASALEQLSVHLMRQNRPFSERETRALSHLERLRSSLNPRSTRARALS